MDIKVLLPVFVILSGHLVVAYDYYEDLLKDDSSVDYDDSSSIEEEDATDEEHNTNNGEQIHEDEELDTNNEEEIRNTDEQHLKNEILNFKNVKPITEEPISRYEVTENVIDVPNNETIPGPIVPTFTITKPLNNGTTFIPNYINKKKDGSFNPKRNYLSILHVNAEYDDKPDINVIQNVNINKYPNAFPGIREYIYGVRKGIANGLQSFTNKGDEDTYNNVNPGIRVPNVIASPVLFFNKLHKQSSEVAARVHNAIFGHRLVDE